MRFISKAGAGGGSGAGSAPPIVMARAPIATDDSDAGYFIGQHWIDTSVAPVQAYVATDVTVGAAVWQEVTSFDELNAHIADLANPHDTSLSNIIGLDSVGDLVFSKVGAPGINDDAAAGWVLGDHIIDTTTGIIWTVEDTTNGAAVWRQINRTIAHALGGAEHTADTLANLNSKISDATLSDYSNLTSGSVIFANGSGLAQDNANLFWDDATKSLGIGNSPVASAALDVSSTTKGFLMPRMTTVQRDAIVSPASGLFIYNVTTGRHNMFHASAWKQSVVTPASTLAVGSVPFAVADAEIDDDPGLAWDNILKKLITVQLDVDNVRIDGSTISSIAGDLNVISASGGVFKFVDNAFQAGLDAVEYVEVGHGGSNGFINAVGDGGLDFRFGGVTKATFTSAGHLHLMTDVDQKHTLKIVTANNLNDTGLAWENSGGSFTHTIFRTDVGSNRADLIFAAGLNSDIDLLTNSFKIHGEAADEGKLEVIGDFQISSGSPALDKVLTSLDAFGNTIWKLASGGGWTDAGSTVILTDINDDVGCGTSAPNAKFDCTGTPGTTVGGFASGQLHVTNPSAVEFANSVITGHNLFSTNTQLWYLGSVSSSNNDIAIINRQTGSLSLHTNNIERINIGSAGAINIFNSLSVGFAGAIKASTILQVDSTTKGTMGTRWTDTQETTNVAALVAGDEALMWFNITTKQFMGWNGTVAVVIG